MSNDAASYPRILHYNCALACRNAEGSLAVSFRLWESGLISSCLRLDPQSELMVFKTGKIAIFLVSIGHVCGTVIRTDSFQGVMR